MAKRIRTIAALLIVLTLVTQHRTADASDWAEFQPCLLGITPKASRSAFCEHLYSLAQEGRTGNLAQAIYSVVLPSADPNVRDIITVHISQFTFHHPDSEDRRSILHVRHRWVVRSYGNIDVLSDSEGFTYLPVTNQISERVESGVIAGNIIACDSVWEDRHGYVHRPECNLVQVNLQLFNDDEWAEMDTYPYPGGRQLTVISSFAKVAGSLRSSRWTVEPDRLEGLLTYSNVR